MNASVGLVCFAASGESDEMPAFYLHVAASTTGAVIGEVCASMYPDLFPEGEVITVYHTHAHVRMYARECPGCDPKVRAKRGCDPLD
jgi:hypothetical protein